MNGVLVYLGIVNINLGNCYRANTFILEKKEYFLI
jgi:hypothetical protein